MPRQALQGVCSATFIHRLPSLVRRQPWFPERGASWEGRQVVAGCHNVASAKNSEALAVQRARHSVHCAAPCAGGHKTPLGRAPQPRPAAHRPAVALTPPAAAQQAGGRQGRRAGRAPPWHRGPRGSQSANAQHSLGTLHAWGASARAQGGANDQSGVNCMSKFPMATGGTAQALVMHCKGAGVAATPTTPFRAFPAFPPYR